MPVHPFHYRCCRRGAFDVVVRQLLSIHYCIADLALRLLSEMASSLPLPPRPRRKDYEAFGCNVPTDVYKVLDTTAGQTSSCASRYVMGRERAPTCDI